MSGPRLGHRGLAQVQRELSQRDRTIIGHVGELRLMSAGQIESVCFPTEEFASALSARRVARRVLERLTRGRLLTRLDRRIGGVSSGSSGFIYALGPVGARVLSDEGQRRHYREPSAIFANHTLAISQLAVDLMNAPQDALEIVDLQAEPRCWRHFGGLGGQTVLRPDLFVCLGIGPNEHRWFIEMDLGTEHIPTLVRKCQVYLRYYQSGVEQRQHDVFPRVCWVLPNQRRLEQLERALKGTSHMVEGLFALTTPEQVVTELVGGPS